MISSRSRSSVTIPKKQRSCWLSSRRLMTIIGGVAIAPLLTLAFCTVVAGGTGCSSDSGAAMTSRAPGDLTITHAAVLDVVTGAVRRNQTVVVINGVITAVTATSTNTPPRGSPVIDAYDRLLTPGF